MMVVVVDERAVLDVDPWVTEINPEVAGAVLVP